MPAVAKEKFTPGSSSMDTPRESASMHSSRCKARSAEWFAASAAEQAVSKEMQAPFKPSTKDMRPDATEWLLPVAEYTLRARDGVDRTSSA
jgi:hypothetical protein